MIKIFVTLIFAGVAAAGLIGLREEAVRPTLPFRLQCSHINQVVRQFDLENGATRQVGIFNILYLTF